MTPVDWIQQEDFSVFSKAVNYARTQFAFYQSRAEALGKSLHIHGIDLWDPDVLNNSDNDYIITNSYVIDQPQYGNRYQVFPDSWYGCYAGNPAYQHQTPVWSYNCFINRMDVTRQSWLYMLVRKKLFDQGLISFNMDVSRHGASDVRVPQHVFEEQFQQFMTNFAEEHNWVKPLVPYKNFQTENLNDVIMQTKFSLVLETYVGCNDAITHSEKIFRCLKLPRPWLLFGMKNSVANLRRMKFDTLDDIVDHSYDLIDDPIQKQSAILDIMPDLSELEFTSTVSDRLESAAEHNRQRLHQLYTTFYTDCDSTFRHIFEKMQASQ